MVKRLVLFVFISGRVLSQTWVTLPDTNFASLLRLIVPSAINNNNQLNISNPIVTDSTFSITAYNKNISNLYGIQYFTSLTYLDCGHNFLTNIPPLPNTLKHFSCGGNILTNLPALPSTLIYLYCENNKIIQLPTLPNSLQVLECDFDSLSNLPVLSNSLLYLSCSYNKLITLPSLPNSLVSLFCNNNKLTALPVLPNGIQDCICYDNGIECFSYFPHSITSISLEPNPSNCLPNYIPAMGSDTTTYPLCAAGNSNGCAVAGIEKINDNHILTSVYPNPFTNSFNIQTQKTIDEIAVKNTLDVEINRVLNINNTFASMVISPNNAPGMYFIVLKFNDGEVATKVVIKQ